MRKSRNVLQTFSRLDTSFLGGAGHPTNSGSRWNPSTLLAKRAHLRPAFRTDNDISRALVCLQALRGVRIVAALPALAITVDGSGKLGIGNAFRNPNARYNISAVGGPRAELEGGSAASLASALKTQFLPHLGFALNRISSIELLVRYVAQVTPPFTFCIFPKICQSFDNKSAKKSL